MNSKKIAVLAAVIPLLAIALTGLSLAHWDDQVDVRGSVSLGTFNMKMSYEGVSDNEGSLDVGSIQAAVTNYDDGDDVYDNGMSDMLTVNITNMYPGYEACVTFDIENAGTIPAVTPASSFTTLAASSEFDWATYAPYINVTLYYNGNDTVGNLSVMLAHQNYDTNGHYVADYDFTSDPYQILYMTPGEHEYFTLCIGLNGSADHNTPEDIMGMGFGFQLSFDWTQAVPASTPE
ncbi:MAG: hypothetical protein GSR80_000830 [Desulfurococcales archaeon]|nr:hypothetical protein [Desulfurococcales archaeon]